MKSWEGKILQNCRNFSRKVISVSMMKRKSPTHLIHIITCIGSSISKNIKKSSKHFTDYIGNSTRESIFFLPTNEIIELFRQLRNTSSAGHDDIKCNIPEENNLRNYYTSFNIYSICL